MGTDECSGRPVTEEQKANFRRYRHEFEWWTWQEAALLEELLGLPPEGLQQALREKLAGCAEKLAMYREIDGPVCRCARCSDPANTMLYTGGTKE